MELKQVLKQRALEIGFDLVGVAPVRPGKDLDFAREWSERGFGGEMRYLANSKRFDPRAVLPGVNSVICVGLIYGSPLPYSTEVGSRQKPVSRKQGAEVRSQESEVRSQKPEVRRQETGPSSPLVRQPSPSGRGCPDAIGRGEGLAEPLSSFDFPISIFEFRPSGVAEPSAWISRYAWGRDYHEIVREKLERLRAAVEQLAPGVETRVFVDTGPVIERAFARFSGLGWMGKNTCIINEEKGSWFFLGVILTNLELDPDLPAPDRCGSCRACLDACPTGALVEPYVMDASRCISYLTIELKGSIPQELRSRLGVNVFGCDICQDVCPWNSRQLSVVSCESRSFEPMVVSYQRSVVSNQRAGDSLALAIQNPKSKIQNPPSPSSPPPEPRAQHPEPATVTLFNPPMEFLASLTEQDFRKLFAHSTIKRAKYRGWLRNLCVAMGNSGDVRLLARLQELSRYPDPIVREHAEWALDQLRQP